MQLGKTLVGAIIGAILGIGLLVAVYFLFGIDKMWMAIPVALLTGLGVRMAVATSGHASYLRGAITVLFAMGAYLGGLSITKAVANHRAATVAQPSAHANMDQSAGGPGAKESASEPAAPTPQPGVPDAAQGHPVGAIGRPAMPGQFSPWDFISLAVAALLAYELGRGTGGASKETMPTAPSEPDPAGTHRDA
jgi:ABC-type antimicrobial peptide transport system permease subunit